MCATTLTMIDSVHKINIVSHETICTIDIRVGDKEMFHMKQKRADVALRNEIMSKKSKKHAKTAQNGPKTP